MRAMKPLAFETPLAALRHAVGLFDTQEAFGEAIGKRQSYVSMLLRRVEKNGAKIPEDICPAIEGATDGKVRRQHLRPDVNWAFVDRALASAQQAASA